MVTQRSSSSEWSGSGTVIESVSAKTVVASAKPTPCFCWLRRAFRESHSNRMGLQVSGHHARERSSSCIVRPESLNLELASLGKPEVMLR